MDDGLNAAAMLTGTGLIVIVSVFEVDVYKRQAEMVENPVLEEIEESVPMLDEVAGRQEREERLGRLELLDPVSYTHLDVYKRQSLGRIRC